MLHHPYIYVVITVKLAAETGWLLTIIAVITETTNILYTHHMSVHGTCNTDLTIVIVSYSPGTS